MLTGAADTAAARGERLSLSGPTRRALPGPIDATLAASD